MVKAIRQLILGCVCGISSLSAESLQEKKIQEMKHHILNQNPPLEGWCSKEKAQHFIDLVFQCKPQVCVELGVYCGASLYPVAAALKHLDEGVVIGIDAWDKLECVKYLDPIEDEHHLAWWTKIDLSNCYVNLKKFIRRNGLDKSCVLLRKSSIKAVTDLGEIDILHIDGNPSEIIRTQEVLLYLPKVKTGGYIWFNDVLNINSQQAVELLLQSCDVIKLIDNGNCILFQKR